MDHSVSMFCILQSYRCRLHYSVYFMTYFVLLSFTRVCSVVTAHNLTQVKCDDWNVYRVCLSHVRHVVHAEHRRPVMK